MFDLTSFYLWLVGQIAKYHSDKKENQPAVDTSWGLLGYITPNKIP